MLSRTPKSLQETANTLFGRHPVPQHTPGTQNSTALNVIPAWEPHMLMEKPRRKGEGQRCNRACDRRWDCQYG